MSLGELQQAYADRRYDDAWAIYRALEATGAAGAEARICGALAAQCRGDLFAARAVIELALQAKLPEGDLLGRLRFAAGEIYLRIGETRLAINQLQAFIAGREGYPQLAEMALGSAWYNLGLALRQSGDHLGAIEAYQMACELDRAADMLQHLCEDLHNLAWVACITGRHELAADALREAEPLARDERLRWHQRLGEAFLEAVRPGGDQRRALELCEAIVGDYGDVPLDVRSHACWVAGRVALDLGLTDQAEGLALRAVEYGARARGENRCLTDAAELLRRVREIRLQPQPPGSD